MSPKTFACTRTYIRSHMYVHQCKLVYACTYLYIHTCKSTRTQKHARTLLLYLDLLRFGQFCKKKCSCHSMLISKCNNNTSKQHVNPCKVWRFQMFHYSQQVIYILHNHILGLREDNPMNVLLTAMFDRINQLKLKVVYVYHLLHLADCCVYSI